MNPPCMALHGKKWRVTKRIPKDCASHYEASILRHYTDCTNELEARPIAWQCIADWEAEFSRIRATGSKFKASITDDEINRLCLGWLAASMQADEDLRIDQHYRDNPELVQGGIVDADTAGERMRASRKVMESAARTALSEGVFVDSLRLTALNVLSQNGYQLPEQAFNRFLYALSKRVVEAIEASGKRDSGVVVPAPVVPPPPPAKAKPKPETEDVSLRLSAVAEHFLSRQKKDKPRFLKDNRVVLLFIDAVGGNKPVKDLKQMDVEDFLQLACRLPLGVSTEKQKRVASLQKLAEDNRGGGISPNTFKDTYLSSLRKFLKDSARVFGDQGFPRTLTVEGVAYSGQVKDDLFARRGFTPEELKLLFEGEYMTKARQTRAREYEFWFPLIGLYTGARVNEVCQLNPQSDIQQEHGIWVFDFTDEGDTDTRVRKSIKNAVSRRVVPIHSKLIKLGFLNYVARIKREGEKLLFPQWRPTRGKASAGAIKHFGRLLGKLGLRDDTPGNVVAGYHAFRHTVQNFALNAGIQNIRVILGHAGVGEVSAVERKYEGKMAIANKQKIIEQLTYDLTFEPPTD